MFTGLVQGVGTVRSFEDGVLLLDSSLASAEDPWRIGESVAVNGCCLTVVAKEPALRFDLSPETLARTALGSVASPGAKVNLERAMKASDRFGGHIVQGHVDAVGSLVSLRPEGNSTVFRFRVPPGSGRYLIDKGSVAIDGISLTVVQPEQDEFDVWIIPHTLEVTCLGNLQPGDAVNLEYDVVAKYVERLASLGCLPQP